MLGWLKRLFGGKPGTALTRSVTSDFAEPTIYPDGFIPAAQFESAGLEVLYGSTAMAYACIVSNAIEAASLGAQVQTRKDGRWIRTEHPHLTAFLGAPSGPTPHGKPTSPPQWSWSQLIFLQVAHLYLDGDAFLAPNIVRNGKRLWSVAPLLPNCVDISKDKDTGYPTGYKAGVETYETHELVHTMFTSPLAFHTGHAPISAALSALGIGYAATQRIRWNLDNKIAPGVILSVDGLFGATDDQRTAILKYLTDNYVGASQDGRPLVFGDGTKIVGAPSEQGKADLVALIEHAEKQIRAVFRTPPPVVGVYDNATLSNFDKAFELWWLLGLFPILETIYSAINTQLIHPIYGPDTRLWWDDRNSPIAQLLQGKLIAQQSALIKNGYPPNFAAKFVGLDIEPVEGLDVPLMNLAVAGRTE